MPIHPEHDHRHHHDARRPTAVMVFVAVCDVSDANLEKKNVCAFRVCRAVSLALVCLSVMPTGRETGTVKAATRGIGVAATPERRRER